MRKTLAGRTLLLAALVLLLATSLAPTLAPSPARAAQNAPVAGGPVFLPLLLTTPRPAPTINAPYFGADDVLHYRFAEMAITWFGHVDSTANYTDMRLGYNATSLSIHLNTFDRRIWWNEYPTPATLTQYDSASLYLDLDGNIGGAPTTNTYRFDVQVYWWGDKLKFQAGYRWDGSGWAPLASPFTALSYWVGLNGPNTNGDARGWWSSFNIPFASLGLPAAPQNGTTWGLGVAVHDRDDSAGTAIPDRTWPAGLSPSAPSTWGRVSFGLPIYAAPNRPAAGAITIRNKLNGALVTDVAAGASTGNLCNGDPNYIWNGWGYANYNLAPDFNIQNQTDLGDWPCFAKYYLTFPLGGLPRGKVILSAHLTLHEFGSSDPATAHPSLIQVLTVNAYWDEATLNWNNAPQPMENVSQTWVNPTNFPGWPGIPYTWDVTYAVAGAYNSGQPLRLAMYDADYYNNSGKFFVSSDTPDWNYAARPSLDVVWADP